MSKSFYHQPSKAKLIAMVDLFAFLLILLLFLFLKNPSEQELGEAMKENLALRNENVTLTNQVDEVRRESEALASENEAMRKEFEVIQARLERENRDKEILLHRFKKEIAFRFPELKTELESDEFEYEHAFLFMVNATKAMAAKMEEKEKLGAGREAISEGRGGSFEAATAHFTAGDFMAKPVDEFRDPTNAKRNVNNIIQQYKSRKNDYPYIFVIGHANSVDILDAEDSSVSSRRKRNWWYAMRRAIAVASLLERRLKSYGLPDEILDNVIIASTGEFDQRMPGKPFGDENAWVEVVFGRDWKLPARFSITGATVAFGQEH